MKYVKKLHPIAAAAFASMIITSSALAQDVQQPTPATNQGSVPPGAVTPGAPLKMQHDASGQSQAMLDAALQKARMEGYVEGQIRSQAHLTSAGLPLSPPMPTQPITPGAPSNAAGVLPGQLPAPGTPVSGVPSLPDLPGGTPSTAGAQGSPSAQAAASTQRIDPSRLAVNDMLPQGISADIYELKRRMDEITRSQLSSSAKVSKPVTRSIKITQAAGEEPPSVRVAMGVPTNIVFLDSTGQPWPIEYAIPGDASKFEIIMPTGGSSSLQLRPKNPYGYAGISVKLKDNHIPVSLSVNAGQDEVDSRLDIRVSARGPNASAPIIDRTGAPNLSDVSLASFLDNVPPEGAKKLKTSRNGVQAWSWAGRLVVRSDVPMIAPAWVDSTSSPNGITKAYILPMVPKVTVSDEGKLLLVDITQ